MVEFEDTTLIESQGFFDIVQELMEVPKWMLRSNVYITTADGQFGYVINFWNTKRVIIDEVMRSLMVNSPASDLSELSNWCEEHGWNKPEPSPRLLENPRQFDFWQRQYQSGLVNSEELDQRESDFMERIKPKETKNASKEL